MSLPHDLDRNRELAEARRFAAVLEGSNDAVIVQGLDGVVSAWNRGAQQMYGYSESEAVGMNISELVPGHLGEGLWR